MASLCFILFCIIATYPKLGSVVESSPTTQTSTAAAIAKGRILASDPMAAATYTATFDMKNLSFLDALCLFLESFHPVATAEAVDAYMEAFTTHYWATNTHHDHDIIATRSNCFYLAYSVLMLNVDLHSPVLVDRPKMTFDQYKANLRNVSDVFTDELLTRIYHRIKKHRID